MSRYRKVVARIPDKKKLCEVCKGNGSIIVQRAICMVPLEEMKSCPECEGQGYTSTESGGSWRFWRRR